jgi:hypothetical protein
MILVRTVNSIIFNENDNAHYVPDYSAIKNYETDRGRHLKKEYIILWGG